MKTKEYTKYVCEVCGRAYDTEKEARDCEKRCVFAGKKDERYAKIRDEIKQFNKDYPDERLYIRRTNLRDGSMLSSDLDLLFNRIMGA